MVQYKKDICRSCLKEQYIVNASRKLCQYCNVKRLSEQKVDHKNENKPVKKPYLKEKIKCSVCGNEHYLVNAKYQLCGICNNKRLQEGKELKIYELKKTPLSPISVKQKEINKTLYTVYDSMKKPDMKCSGCGTKERLTPSHLIPRSRRADLITDPRNITWHCVGMGEKTGCHEIWESHDRKKLKDYNVNMTYIKEVDFEYYKIIRDKDNDY